ncbi:VWA domain-containing protein [Devosia ginsengisoli]|uniref:vWA domain-containing protein n=1 Tax=Devosia ginsengisoli TaxID=400770 RepID=UPI0026F29BCE|nr:von Willebrand factor type A domain-containing protein [Devosia ginsengisoli]MCR6671726.1 von Willebrand factor type A domain-containing protein [Devosia ginsengisoli]
MDMRLPIGTAAIALLVLPLGYQLYSTTSMTAPTGVAVQQPALVEPPTELAATEELAETPATSTTVTAPEPTPVNDSLADSDIARDAVAPQAGGNAGIVPKQQMSIGAAPAARMAESEALYMPSPAPMPSIAMQPQPSGDAFTSFDEQRLKAVAEEPVSTFSIDVDTASYSYVRRMLEDGYVPEPDAVRIEEMINYFPYAYPAADSAQVPFKPTIGVYPTPWNPKTQLLQIGIKGYVPDAGEDKPSNLVFLIDTSGSMDEADKLPLLKRAFGLLVDQLSANDTVSIVVYAGSAGVVLEPTVATEKAKILRGAGPACGRRQHGGRGGDRAGLSAGRAGSGGRGHESRDPGDRWRFQCRHRQPR